MSLYHQKEVRIHEPFTCPECGAVKVMHVVEEWRLDDGTVIKRLRHFKCQACGERLFDDNAMHRILEKQKAGVAAKK